MRSGLAILLLSSLTACGRTPAPLAPPPPPPAPPPVTQVMTCDDVGPLLRGPMAGDLDEATGRSREAVIIKHCKQTRWARAVLDCVGKTPSPRDCLERLSDEQLDSYEDQLETWDEAHPEVAADDEEEDWEDGHDFDDDEDDEIACDAAINRVDAWPPALTVTGDDHTTGTALRQHMLIAMCNDTGWSEETKECLMGASGTAATAGCLDDDGDLRVEVTKRLREVDVLVAKASKLRKKAATHSCKQVAAAHYSDARWKQELSTLPRAESTRLKVASRKQLTTVCTIDVWPATLRSCLAAGGGDACAALASPATRWTFPAAGVIVKTGNAECDRYTSAVAKLGASCTAIPKPARDAMVEAAAALSLTYATQPENRAAIATACEATQEALEDAVSSMGC